MFLELRRVTEEAFQSLPYYDAGCLGDLSFDIICLGEGGTVDLAFPQRCSRPDLHAPSDGEAVGQSG